MWSTAVVRQDIAKCGVTLYFPPLPATICAGRYSIQEGKPMKKTIALVAVLAASMGLAACSPKAANETAEAGNAMMSDVNATTADAMNTVDAATDNAMGAIENTADAAGNKIESAADKMKAATGDAMSTAGNKMEAAGDAMKK